MTERMMSWDPVKRQFVPASEPPSYASPDAERGNGLAGAASKSQGEDAERAGNQMTAEVVQLRAGQGARAAQEPAEPESFADYPVSVGEARATKSADWSPREALLSCLRAIDRGELAPTALLICTMTETEDRAVSNGYLACTRNIPEALGLLELVKSRLIAGT